MDNTKMTDKEMVDRLNQSRLEAYAELDRLWNRDDREHDTWELTVLTKAREALNDPPIPALSTNTLINS